MEGHQAVSLLSQGVHVLAINPCQQDPDLPRHALKEMIGKEVMVIGRPELLHLRKQLSWLAAIQLVHGHYFIA
jgi:hypothetical protein